MKRLSLFLSFFLFLGIIFAQENQKSRNIFRTGINGAFFGAGDIFGIGISTAYVYNVNDFLSITPRIMLAFGNDVNDVSSQYIDYHQITALGTSVSLRLTPFPKSFRRLKIDIGGLYQRFTKSHGQLGQEDAYGSYDGNVISYYAKDLLGFLGSVNFNCIETESLESGFRFEILTSLSNGDLACDGVQTGIYLGFKF